MSFPYNVSRAKTVSSIGVFPARSPMPLTVVWMQLAPAAAAMTLFATPRP